jgi:hypothetical protein
MTIVYFMRTERSVIAMYFSKGFTLAVDLLQLQLAQWLLARAILSYNGYRASNFRH